MNQAHQIHQTESPFIEWVMLRSSVFRYRGRVFIPCRIKRDIIRRNISSQWKSAEELARECRLPFHSVVKIMVNMAEAGEVMAREEEWVDDRCRKRSRSLYKARQAESKCSAMDMLIMRALGVSAAPVDVHASQAHCRKHYLGD